MESLLEQQRRYHEERERLIDAMVHEQARLYTIKKDAKEKDTRETIHGQHRVHHMLDRYGEVTQRLKEIYEDKDGQRKEEVQALSGPNEFQEFYSRLKQIKEFHKRHPGEVSVPMTVEFEQLRQEEALVEFTDEEGYGKYLDLHECYEKYVNLKGVDRFDYVEYLLHFDKLFDVPKQRKGADYKDYLKMLIDYFYHYMRRIRPLYDIDADLEACLADFEAKYASGDFPGWPKEAPGGALVQSGAHLDLSGFSTPEELSSLGPDRLKSALMALGLKCGGTLEERARRLFLTKGKSLNELDASLFAKKKGAGAGGASEKARNAEKQKEVASLEAQVYKFADLLSEHRTATKENIERKQARTDLERDDSDSDVSEEEPEEEDEDDDIPYNPKNLPLGWDGKPIPYWLYKLHGLNISYDCEICGNFTYKGPKAFQRHFAEWRHAHGMRCLGIPNTAHFANVTQIEDAMALWEKLKGQKAEEAWKPEQEEEFEDSQGNVVTKKIYEDLKRQGLL